ncbi:unnamed protein product [Didymodactylos carnosus]|uniref:Integral membrane protein GPR155 n=1 Tax=Didymodactylos carnosus TaxID=1234261 RepID=A0A813XJ90_9BILA|nr:unnamed protein product [Didymodactylos carnosus]CAF3663716.1 unnamed protein product [Didymodactylos carnosus]
MNNSTDDNIPAINKELYPALVQCFVIITFGYIAGQLSILTQSHSTGLSRYISNFALPALIFKNLVTIHFGSVSWPFLASIFIGKSIIFFLTALITSFIQRPINYANIGLYSIITSQSNDFALGYPIVEAVYQHSHPDYLRYIYLIAPISLVILNPLGFLLIETQSRLNDKRLGYGHVTGEYSSSRLRLISKIICNLLKNPMVVATILGCIFNPIFKQTLPYMLLRIITPLADSFGATALFYLGLQLVGKIRKLHSYVIFTVMILSMIKSLILPLLIRQIVFMLKPKDDTNSTLEYSNYGFLYGTFPVAPTVIFYVPEQNIFLQSVASTCLVVSTLLAAPIMLISAKMIALKTIDNKTSASYENTLCQASFDVSIISLLCTIIVFIGFILRRRWKKNSLIHRYTLILLILQLMLALWNIPSQYMKIHTIAWQNILHGIGSVFLALATRTWSASIAFILMTRVCYGVQKTRQLFWLYHLFGWSLPIISIILVSVKSVQKQTSLVIEKFGKIQVILSIIVLLISILLSIYCLVRLARRTYRLKHDENHRRSSHSDTTLTNESRPLIDTDDNSSRQNDELNKAATFSSSIITWYIDIFVDTKWSHSKYLVCLSILIWSFFDHSHTGIYYELQFVDAVLLYGQGFITFLVFALDVDVLLPIARSLGTGLSYVGYRGLQEFLNANKQTKNRRHETMDDDTLTNFEQNIKPNFLDSINEPDSFRMQPF